MKRTDSQNRYYERVKDTPKFRNKSRLDSSKHYHEVIKLDSARVEERNTKTLIYQQKRREIQQGIRRQLQAILGGKCSVCAIDDFRVLDFDHLNPIDKSMNISQKLHLPFDILVEETKKCQLLCANCHRIKTIEEKEFNARIRKFRNPSMASSFS